MAERPSPVPLARAVAERPLGGRSAPGRGSGAPASCCRLDELRLPAQLAEEIRG